MLVSKADQLGADLSELNNFPPVLMTQMGVLFFRSNSQMS